MTLKAAIIGFGNIAKEHLKGYQVAEGVMLAAVADQSSDRLQALQHTHVQTFTNVDEMLATVRPDVVSICTPPATHRALAEKAFAAGAHVLCEKPLAQNSGDGKQMIEAAKSADRLLAVAFCHRFIPAIRRICELINTGAIGKPLLYRNQFSGPFNGVEKTWFSNPDLSGGGTLMDTTIHSVDLFHYLLGEITQVRALASTTRDGLRVEDTSIVLVSDSEGCIGTLEASWTVAPGTLLIEVRGTHGEIFYDYATLRWRAANTSDWHEEQFPDGIDKRFIDEIQHFVDVLQGKCTLEIDATSTGLRSLQILEQAYADIRRS